MQSVVHYKGRTMRRFAMNRWCAFLLTFVLVAGALPGFVAPASALTIRQAQWSHSGGSSDYGDPDIPGTSGVPMPGRMEPTVTNPDSRLAAGDSRYASEWERALRLRVVLELLRAWLFR